MYLRNIVNYFYHLQYYKKRIIFNDKNDMWLSALCSFTDDILCYYALLAIRNRTVQSSFK